MFLTLFILQDAFFGNGVVRSLCSSSRCLQQQQQQQQQQQRPLYDQQTTTPTLHQRGITAMRINKNIEVLQHVHRAPNPRPLVLLFGWLFAKPSHLKKFSEFYGDLGFDVIAVQVI